MPEPINLTDATIDSFLNTDKPVLLFFTNGSGMRGDFKSAFDKLAGENPKLTVARIDPSENPQTAARFGVEGDKPTLIGVYCGEAIVRRVRPWGTDLPLAVEAIETLMRDQNPQAYVDEAQTQNQAEEKPVTVLDAPVKVTDETFEQEVLNSELPVIVDFWAEWCGPCRMVGPILDKMAKEFGGQIKVAKVNVDENPGLSQAFRIQSIPNLMVVKEKTIVFNQPGALPEASMRDLITQAIALQLPPREAQEQPQAESQPEQEQPAE